MHTKANFSAFHFLEQSVYEASKWEDEKCISDVYLFSQEYSEDYDEDESNILRSFQTPGTILTWKTVQWLNQE